MSKNQFTGSATQPQRNRKFCQFKKDQYCLYTDETEIKIYIYLVQVDPLAYDLVEMFDGVDKLAAAVSYLSVHLVQVNEAITLLHRQQRARAAGNENKYSLISLSRTRISRILRNLKRLSESKIDTVSLL